MTMKVGFIGLGIMGKPMSKNLLKAGYSLVVADRNPEAIADVIAAGAETASTAKAIAEQCDVIITMLPNSPHVNCLLYTNPHPGICDVCQSALGGLFPSGSFLPPRQ
uniref:NAD(P)-binding domain-containing protein n=3 Tax=Escherichia coli TaxID=562 RepID=UPI000A823FD6